MGRRLALGRFCDDRRRLDGLVAIWLVAALATERAAELTDPLAQGAAELRQPLGPEDDERDDQDDRQLERSNVWHWLMVTGLHRDRIESNWVAGLLKSGISEKPREKVRIESLFPGFDREHMRNASTAQTKTETGLHVCPGCGSHLVQPTCWEQAGDRGHWRLWRRCPECGWSGQRVHGEAEIDAFDEELDLGTRSLAEVLKALERENMQYVADTLAAALEADLISADDFR